MNNVTILVIEDHPDIVDLLRHALESQGFEVRAALDGEEGLAQAISHPPSLILLDLMLPQMDGLAVCKALKRRPDTKDIPIIMLTAKDEKENIVAGLRLGADDYVPKPFDIEELVARIQAVLRRTTTLPREKKSQDYVKVDDLVIDSIRHEVTLKGEELTLTLAEFKLLRALAASRGRVFTRDQLLERVRGLDVTILDRNIDVHIAALRKKLGDYADRVITIRGVGYRFQD